MSAPNPFPLAPEPQAHGLGHVLPRGQANPALTEHRLQYGTLANWSLDQLQAACDGVELRGRGGAAFPFGRKLRTASQRPGPHTVVANFGEGEPVSAKDEVLARVSPHLVLDGLLVTARALQAKNVQVVVPAERPHVERRLAAALAERRDAKHVQLTRTQPGFVSGQARAVVELLSGRENLPVVSWEPEAVSGVNGRPTLLSNAETWAQVGLLATRGVAAYRAIGSPTEPGTTLLTFRAPGAQPMAAVAEVELGRAWCTIMPEAWRQLPVLVGGYHGSWVWGDHLWAMNCSVAAMREVGVPLGAGVILATQECPVLVTSQIVDYLAGQVAGRCGPCVNGLPALATAVRAVARGRGSTEQWNWLMDLVRGRGACAHPDGTTRIVASLARAFPQHLAEHERGYCTQSRGGAA